MWPRPAGLWVDRAGIYTIVAGDGAFAATSAAFTDFSGDTNGHTRLAATSIIYDGTSDVTNWAVPAVNGVSGVANPTGSPIVVFYSGTSATGTPLASPPINVGTYTAVASYSGDANYATAQSVPVTFTISTPLTVAVSQTATGFTAQFSHVLDTSQLNLYDQGGNLGPADVVLTGNTTGAVAAQSF